MTTTTTGSSAPPDIDDDLVRVARTTGLIYLAFFVVGILGFLVVRPQLYVADDPQGTLDNLLDSEALARIGIVLELGIVLSQALVAVWFYRLFRRVDRVAAGALAGFGLVNAVVILSSAGVLATALDVAQDESLSGQGDPAATVQMLYALSGNLWGVGALFFGLWLIPMGWLVLRSGWMPRVLGWLLVVAGALYLGSALLTYLFPDAASAIDLLTVPASVGEAWIMGYLVIFGVRRRAATPAPGRESAATR